MYMYLGKPPPLCKPPPTTLTHISATRLHEWVRYMCLLHEQVRYIFIYLLGIKEVIYYSDKYHEKPEFVASRRLLDQAGVKYWWVKYTVISRASVPGHLADGCAKVVGGALPEGGACPGEYGKSN